MSDERIEFNGDTLDEVVMSGMVHIEAMNAHDYMIMVYTSDGRRLHLNGQNVWMLEEEGCGPLMRFGEPLLYCGHNWRYVVEHTCTLDKDHVGRHQCDCQDKGRRNNDGTPVGTTLEKRDSPRGGEAA